MSHPKKHKKSHRLRDWVITPPYIAIFVSILVLFHPLHLAASLISRRLHKRMLDLMNLAIVLNIRFVTGAGYRVIGAPSLPEGRPVILVSNHQSMYDIPMLMWECRHRDVGFISKRELGRWIPSISLALRRLGSVLIERNDPNGALDAIRRFGVEKSKQSQVAAIFPEGTRARDGVVKRFKTSGLRVLLEAMPDALVQPVAIRGNWELLSFNFWPVPYGTNIELEFLSPLEPGEYERDYGVLIKDLEDSIAGAVRGPNA
jgi:1-acyl-sn-glycerol-3-phosphate acyltransferase